MCLIWLIYSFSFIYFFFEWIYIYIVNYVKIEILLKSFLFFQDTTNIVDAKVKITKIWVFTSFLMLVGYMNRWKERNWYLQN